MFSKNSCTYVHSIFFFKTATTDKGILLKTETSDR